MTAAVGVTLQPDERYLELLEPLFATADYLEVTPETTWRRDDDGAWCPNGYWRAFLDLGARYGKPFVGHAVCGSFGTADANDLPRQRAWQARIAEDHAAFHFLWLTDHLGAAMLDGRAVTLPIALPMTAAAAAVVRARLMALQEVVPDTGIENSVFYFLLGDWRDEPAFLGDILSAPRTHLLLDLHNVHTMAQNLGVDPCDYLDRLDLARVIEIHLSGGSDSEPRWLPSGRVLRLDSHDHAVPEEVWRLYERTAPRCANLRGVTLERMEGTVDDGDVDGLRRELSRAREVLGAGRR
ncbi:MAG: DUF692 family protein [Planctomycetota bacterium]